MKASQFSDAQKAFILKQGAEGVPVADICRKAGISPATYFNWKKKYAGILPTDMKRLRELEDENSRLKKIVADYRDDSGLPDGRHRLDPTGPEDERAPEELGLDDIQRYVPADRGR